jgi:hypothetical protein
MSDWRALMTPQKATLDRLRTLSWFVSYRRLSSQFQFSLSLVTLEYLSQWWPPLHWQISHESLPGAGTKPVLTCIQWISQHRNYTNIKVGVPPWEGIQERTLVLRFLGIISRVLRLEVSTLVFCLSTRCYSPNFSFLHWSIVLYGFLKPEG